MYLAVFTIFCYHLKLNQKLHNRKKSLQWFVSNEQRINSLLNNAKGKYRSISFDSLRQQSAFYFFLFPAGYLVPRRQQSSSLIFPFLSELSLARSNRRAKWQIATFSDGHAMLQSVSCSWVGVGFSALQVACTSNRQVLKAVHCSALGQCGQKERKKITIKMTLWGWEVLLPTG